MRKIKIFLASSIIEFSNERMILENFIRNISDKFEEKYNIKLQPLLCENFDDAYTIIRKQEEYNEKIRESDFCFFIFFTKVGEYTREEFDVAREQFEKTGSPKIYTYFKVIEEGAGENSLYAFMNELDKIFGHYYGTFSHIDTIKLRILLSLKLKEMNFLEIKTDNGECVIDGAKIMPLDNVAEFANNAELKKLIKELEEIETEYYKLKPLYGKNNNDTDFYKRYSSIASRRQNLIDEIEELQKLIFNISLHMVEDDTRGTITERQKRAYRLFEQGDYEGCMSVLNADDIDSDFIRSRNRLRDQELAICRKYIKEHKTAIDILSSMKAYDKRFEEIKERYEKIIPYILELKIEMEIAEEYVNYLVFQNRDNEAFCVAKQLLDLYEDAGETKAGISCVIGTICSHLNQTKEAESFYLESIKLYESLVRENPERFNVELAIDYNNVGIFYEHQGQFEEAKSFYLKALALYELLAEKNPERFNSGLVSSYVNLGSHYADKDQLSIAESYFLKSIKICELLVEEKSEELNSTLALCYYNIGVLYYRQGQPLKAERFCLKAIEIYELLASGNPEKFNPDLAMFYNKMGWFYRKQEQLKAAEIFYLKAIEIYELLAKENPERFKPNLAMFYYSIGDFYRELEQPEKAERFYLKSIDVISMPLITRKFDFDFACVYHGVGSFYNDQKDTKKAENFYLKAIEIYELLARENPKRYNPDLANCHNVVGNFYRKQGQSKNAEKHYLKVEELYELLAKENPEKFNSEFAIKCNNIGVFYHYQNNQKEAERLWLKAIEIYESLVKVEPERYSELIPSYVNISNFYRTQGQPKKADSFDLKMDKIRGLS